MKTRDFSKNGKNGKRKRRDQEEALPVESRVGPASGGRWNAAGMPLEHSKEFRTSVKRLGHLLTPEIGVLIVVRNLQRIGRDHLLTAVLLAANCRLHAARCVGHAGREPADHDWFRRQGDPAD